MTAECNCNRYSCRTCRGAKISGFSNESSIQSSDRVTGLSGSGNAAQNVNYSIGDLETYFNLSTTALKRASFSADAGTEELIPVVSSINVFACTDTSAARTLTISTSTIIQGTLTTPVFIHIKDESGGAATNNITIDTEGAETIDGAVSLTINANYGSVQLYSNGSNLFTVAP